MTGRRVGWGRRIFRILLALYPPGIRKSYGPEMEEVFRRSLEEARRRGRGAVPRLWLRTLRDTAINAPPLWARTWRRARGGGAGVGPGAAAATPTTTRGRGDGMGMDTLWQDVRVASRGFARRPGFTIVALLTLALGIGGTTAIFSLVDATLLDPLPYPEEERVVVLYNSPEPGAAFVGFSDPFYAAMAEEPAGVLSALAAAAPGRANLGGDDAPERVPILRTSASFFEVAAVPPLLGRTFTDREDRPGADGVAVLSHALWERRYGGSPDVLGRTVPVDGRVRQVVGVMPPGFSLLGQEVDLWVPLALAPAAMDETSAMNNNRFLMGRLAPGVDFRRAEVALTRALETVRASFPDAVAGKHSIVLGSYREWLVGDVRRELLLLLGAVAVVLLIACANLANLFLARAEGRRREFALRGALGARSGRLLRQLLTETVLLGLVGAVVGLGFGMALLKLVGPVVPPEVPLPDGGALDRTVLAFAAGVGIVTGALVGLLPALGAMGTRIGEVLGAGGRGGTRAAAGIARRGLVVAEVGLAAVLLVAAGLLVGTLWKLQAVDPGFAVEDRMVAEMSLSRSSYPTAVETGAFFRPLMERVSGLPGVADAAVGQWIPLEGAVNWGFEVEGSEEGVRFADYNLVGPSYFRTLGIPVVRGRAFEWRDAVEDRPVVLVTEALARTLWPGEDPIGRRVNVNIDRRVWREVVGVVGDVRNRSLGSSPGGMLYFPPVELPFSGPRNMSLVVRLAEGADVTVSDLQSSVATLDPSVPVSSLRSLGEVVRGSEARRRFLMILLGGFGAVALSLAGVGIYGILSYTLSLRTREIGVRIALGADRASVVGLALRESGLLVGLGLALGLGGAVAVSRVLTSYLYEITALNAWSYGAAALFLIVVAGAATWIPAWRAAGLDPREALQAE